MPPISQKYISNQKVRSELLQSFVTSQLVFPERVTRASDVSAASALVGSRNVLGFDVTSTVSFVPKVLEDVINTVSQIDKTGHHLSRLKI